MDAQLGDWLGPQNGQLGSAYLATSYYIFALDIMAQTAQILGQAEDAQTYIATRDVQKDFFAETFLMEGIPYGVVGSGPMFNAMLPPFKKQPAATQTAYAVPLALGVIAPELESSMAAELAKVVASEAVDDGGIARPAYSLMTGFIGTAWISKALSDAGYNDEAYRLLTNETYPSWLYSVNQGATTIWERLNGYTVENGFGGNNSMNSFNHYSFGSVGQWMMAYAAGIQREEPGFQRFKLAPAIDRSGSIDWVNAHYDSPYGRIESRWKIMNGEVHYNITIPANTLATIVLPTTGNIVESGKSLLMVEGISNVHGEAHATAMQIGSGSYQFVF
jgi:alpha-L-rhamnosidase